jgi:HlyD family secretion protein
MKRIILVIFLALVACVAGWYAWQHFGVGSDRSAADSSQPGGSSTGAKQCVVGMGRIEPAGGVIDVGAMMGDRLAKLLVEEGAQVKKGKPLAELESRALRKLEVDAAASQLRNAKGRFEIEQQLADMKIDAAKLNVDKAQTAMRSTAANKKKIEVLRATLALAQTDQKRLSGLSKELVSDQERERQALLVQQAAAELESAEASLTQLNHMNVLALKAAQLELKAAVEGKKQLPFAIPIETLEINSALAKAQYARSQVVAPCDGTILRTYVRPGETIGAKPILQIGDSAQMIVVVEVYENEIKHIRLGQEALITSKALPAPYNEKGLRGKVIRVGRMINTPVLKSVDPFAPADRHVVEVRVELDKESVRESADFSNLQVDVRFPKGD